MHRHGAAAGADLSEPERSGVPLRSRESIHQRSFSRSFFATLKKEKIYQIAAYKLPREQVKTIIFRYIFIYYNRVRIYTRNPLGLPPVKYREWVQAQQAA